MKPFTTLISAPALRALQDSAAPAVLLDCGFDLADGAAGERAYAAAHLPGAHYLHLERDLSGPPRDAAGRFHGRHPLPERAALARTLGRLGIGAQTQVVAYDGQGGPFAARLWWLLRWLGHGAVAVLDGGTQAWLAAGGALSNGAAASVAAADYPARDAGMATIAADALWRELGQRRLIDARAPERYRGEVEPLDAAAGHIPGALNRFFRDNLGSDGRFKSAAALRAEFAPLLAGHDAASVIHQCGSGVTACHNLLALAHAGLGDGVLYPGSWSEWSADPQRPVARG